MTIVLLRSAGEEVSGPLTYVLDFVGEHVLPLTILSEDGRGHLGRHRGLHFVLQAQLVAP